MRAKLPSLVLLFALAGCVPSSQRATDVPSVASARAPAPPPRVDTPADKAIAIEPRDVTLAVATAALRTHPIGKRLGPLVAAMPQWRDVAQGVLADPLNDVDWMYAVGPSFARVAKSALLVRHSLTDAVVEERLDLLAQHSPSAAPFDLGVEGAKGTLANFGGGEGRVAVRAHPSVVAVVPPDYAKATASALSRAKVLAPFTAPQVLHATVKHPHDHAPQIPAAIADADVVVTASDDGGAELVALGVCADEAAAQAAADDVRALVRRSNNIFVRFATNNLLGGVDVKAVGANVELRATPSAEQLDATLRVVASMLGVEIAR